MKICTRSCNLKDKDKNKLNFKFYKICKLNLDRVENFRYYINIY